MTVSAATQQGGGHMSRGGTRSAIAGLLAVFLGGCAWCPLPQTTVAGGPIKEEIQSSSECVETVTAATGMVRRDCRITEIRQERLAKPGQPLDKTKE